MSIKIFPSLIAADQLRLADSVAELAPYCDGFHLDVMDNHFVPNLTWGPGMVNALAREAKKILFVHLMTEFPEKIIQGLHLRDRDTIAFHFESISDFYSIKKIITEKKLRPCLAISPKTALSEIFSYLKDVDQVLLMSVDPGFSGQPLLKSSIERLKELNAFKQKHDLQFEICMDGGINEENIHELVEEGATSFAIASAIFSKKDRIAAIKNLYDVALEG